MGKLVVSFDFDGVVQDSWSFGDEWWASKFNRHKFYSFIQFYIQPRYDLNIPKLHSRFKKKVDFIITSSRSVNALPYTIAWLRKYNLYDIFTQVNCVGSRGGKSEFLNKHTRPTRAIHFDDDPRVDGIHCRSYLLYHPSWEPWYAKEGIDPYAEGIVFPEDVECIVESFVDRVL